MARGAYTGYACADHANVDVGREGGASKEGCVLEWIRRDVGCSCERGGVIRDDGTDGRGAEFAQKPGCKVR